MSRPFDIIVYGATGYSGTITCEYLAAKADKSVKWAIAGRQLEKLEHLRQQLAKINPALAQMQMFPVDASDYNEIVKLAQSTKVLCSFVGPYRVYGEPIVRACVQAGTDYVDVTGEPPFLAEVIEKYHASAASKQLYIMPACGVGSLMTDFAVEVLKQDIASSYQTKTTSALGYVRYNGRYAKTFSNGTWNTLVNSMASKGKRAPRPADGAAAVPKKRARNLRVGTHLFKYTKSWALPFVEGADLHSIRRTNELNESSTGSDDFAYAQFTLFPLIPPLWLIFTLLTVLTIMMCSGFSFVRNFLRTRSFPNGGPTKEQRADSSVEVFVTAKDTAGHSKMLHLTCPGPYDSTGVACGETALALVNERSSLNPIYGVVTPGAVMIPQLKKHLKER